MRFVSMASNFSAGNFRNSEETIGPSREVLVGGQRKHTIAERYTEVPAVPFQFSQVGLLQSDIDAAMAHWARWPGLPLEEDEVTPAIPVENGRIGVLDTTDLQRKYSLSDDERQAAEAMLLNSRFIGIDYIVVEGVVAAKPWPSYDTTHHNKIASLASELGLVSEALAYEQENKQRASVIEQLEAVLPAGAEFVSA